MFFKTLLVLTQCLMVSFAAEISQSPVQNLTVKIYYENHCPDSLKFFKENFYPLFVSSAFNGSIHPQLNSAGNTNVTALANGTNAFTCEHGPIECQLNMIHACVIKIERNISAVLNFVNCSLAENFNISTPDPTNQCVKKANINESALAACLNVGVNPNSPASQYLKEFVDERKSLEIDSIPFVVFNGMVDANASARAIDDFGLGMCDFVQARNLSVAYCTNKKNSATSITSISLLPFLMAAFLLTRKVYQ